MSEFQPAGEQLLKDEGSAVVPDDHGRGASKFGITLATAVETEPNWTSDTIETLTEQAAMEYYKSWWERYHIGLIDNQAVAAKVFNLGFNVGPGTAIRFLQDAVGAHPDGNLGPKTAAAVNAQNPEEVLAKLRDAGKIHYEAVASANPELASNLPGWLARLDA